MFDLSRVMDMWEGWGAKDMTLLNKFVDVLQHTATTFTRTIKMKRIYRGITRNFVDIKRCSKPLSRSTFNLVLSQIVSIVFIDIHTNDKRLLKRATNLTYL